MDTSFIMLIVLVIAFVGIFYFLMIRPQRRRQQEHNRLIEGLKRGDKVVTAGGIYGQIDYIDEDTVILRLEGDAKLRVMKYSILRKQSESE